jgi:hypothetical protein
MTAIQDVLSDAVTDRAVPWVVAAAASSDGVIWQGSAGETTGRPAGADTVFRL